MNLDKIKFALKILECWYPSWEKYKSEKRPMFRRAAIRWRALGIINHDRILTERPIVLGLGQIK